MSDRNRTRHAITMGKATNLGRLAKAAVEYMDSKGIDVKSAAFATAEELKKISRSRSKKISGAVGVK